MGRLDPSQKGAFACNRGRGQRWVCISQLMRVSTDRLHHQHPTPIAVEDSVPDISEPRQHRRIIPRSAGAGVTLLSSDNIVCWGCHLAKRRAATRSESIWWWTSGMLQSVNQSFCRPRRWRRACKYRREFWRSLRAAGALHCLGPTASNWECSGFGAWCGCC